MGKLIWVLLFFLCLGCSTGDGDVSNGESSLADEPDAGRLSGDDIGSDADEVLDTDPEVREGCLNGETPGATASCLEATQPEEYYVDEANKYFDTLDVEADRERVPSYSPLVARWEWPPWLLLTGFDRETMISTGDSLRVLDPSTVPVRDCRFFDKQPFARCYVEFEYEGGACPIYEEFTFNDVGEMTFIEAWSDLPGFLPMDKAQDPWAEGEGVERLSTRVPGLGNGMGLIDLESEWMLAASMVDPDVADFALRASDQWKYWGDAFTSAPVNFFEVGCGWEE